MRLLSHLNTYSFLYGTFFILIGLPYAALSPAPLSIGSVICFLPFLTQIIFDKTSVIESLKKSVPFVLLFLIFLASGIWSYENLEWYRKISLKLPYLLIPLGFYSSSNLLKHKNKIYYLWVITIALTALASLVNYAINFDEINSLILQSKSVPIFPFDKGISHIYFSVFSSWACLWAIINYVVNKKKIDLFFAGFLFISMHILSARTGLVAFYITLGLGILIYLKTNKISLKKYFKYLPFIVIIPVLSVYFIPSLKNRIINTSQDISTLKNETDINDRSIAMRVEAWKTTLNIIKNNLLFGVGSGDLAIEMNNTYINNDSILKPYNRIMPHNQFLETWAETGILGFFLLLFLLIFKPIKEFIKKKNLYKLLFPVLCSFSFLVESILERQMGICFFLIFYLLNEVLFEKEKTN